MKCPACFGGGLSNPEWAITQPPGWRTPCGDCGGSGEQSPPSEPSGISGELRSGEQSPTAEELEIDRLRAELAREVAYREKQESMSDLEAARTYVAELEAKIAQERADNRHLREAMQSIRWHALMAGDKADRLVTCLNIATDTLKRVAQ